MMWLWIIFGVWAAVALLIFVVTLLSDWQVYRAPRAGESFAVAVAWPLWLVMAILDRK